MSLKNIILETIKQNPASLKEMINEELRSRIMVSLDEISKETVKSYSNRSFDQANTILKHSLSDLPRNVEKAMADALKRRQTGIKLSGKRLGKDEMQDIADKARRKAENPSKYYAEDWTIEGNTVNEEATPKMKDGYYVNGPDVKLTHDKPFMDSKTAISHANKKENETGKVHRVTKVKDGKIHSQWEYEGGSMDPKWGMFKDFAGEHAHHYFRSVPKHLIHESTTIFKRGDILSVPGGGNDSKVRHPAVHLGKSAVYLDPNGDVEHVPEESLAHSTVLVRPTAKHTSIAKKYLANMKE